MLKKLAQSIREYKTASIMTPVLITGEVILECLIPFIIAMLVNQIKAGCEFRVIVTYGGILFGMACLSLAFGAAAGATSAKASCGFGKNLRHDLFYRVQAFAFENIDKFSSSSLVTRMTTDVFNVQNAYMMIIRVAVRSPLMFLFAIIMSYVMVENWR
jgi:ATP-binding cassette subfamily B protein